MNEKHPDLEKNEAIERAVEYLRAAGMAPEEAARKALCLWHKLSESGQAGLNALMGEARSSIETFLPQASNRPMKLGHMLAANFEEHVAQPQLSTDHASLQLESGNKNA